MRCLRPSSVRLAICLLALASQARASEEEARGAPLSLEAVLDAVEASHPGLEAAARKAQAARGKVQAAKGAWDPSFELKTRWAPIGYYENRQVDVAVQQATPWWGIRGFAGYRAGWGDFPVYKGEYETLSQGELRAGVDVPLWKDGPIDAQRAELQKREQLTDAARCALREKRLKLRYDAAKAYWKWVETGLEMRIQRDLLNVAQLRDSGLREQVAAGSIAEIVAVDNTRLLLDRESKLVEAQRAFAKASLALSLFLRDDEARPVSPGEERIPEWIAPSGQVGSASEKGDVEEALTHRPELCVAAQERDAAEVGERYARNQRAPEARAYAMVARDLGEGPERLAQAEFAAGVTLKLPVALRKARGDHAAAKAELLGSQANLRGTRDRVATEVRQARIDLTLARSQVELAKRQLAAARQLAEAEREKFRHGATDLVIVNLRELAAADAARLEVAALAAAQQAYAAYLTALGRGI